MYTDMNADQQHIAATGHSEETKGHQVTSGSNPIQAGVAGQSPEQSLAPRERSRKRRPEAAREL
jgi:hypothetical protein